MLNRNKIFEWTVSVKNNPQDEICRKIFRNVHVSISLDTILNSALFSSRKGINFHESKETVDAERFRISYPKLEWNDVRGGSGTLQSRFLRGRLHRSCISRKIQASRIGECRLT